MKDFWISCGHHLLDRNASGGLVVTEEFLKAYFARPELMPPEDACEVERRLHRELLADPCRPVSADEVAGIADADARENWQFVLAFRDLLLRHPTLEAAYLALVRSGSVAPAAAVRQPARSRDPAQRARRLRGSASCCARPSCFSGRSGSCRTTSHCFLATRKSLAGSSMTPVLSLMSMLGATDGGANRRARR